MSKNFKITLATLIIVGIIGALLGPKAIQKKKMEEASLWKDENRSLISEIAEGDDLDLSISTGLYFKVAAEVRDKDRISEIKSKFKQIEAPLPFKFMLSVKPKANLSMDADYILIKVHERIIKISDALSIKKLLEILNKNKGGNDHKCMENGYIVIVKGEEKTKLELVPSHSGREVEFRFNKGLYTVDKKDFFSIDQLKTFKDKISQKIDFFPK